MAYNMPPPWDPGFALPGNVRDEGLQRRAFVTKQLPRGSYYQSDVGTGGYVLPQYVQDEGYGQGTFTTKWAPSGTYVGPKIPHFLNQRPQTVAQVPIPGGGKAVTIQRVLSGFGGVSGDESTLPEPFETYGQRAATALMDRVGKLPPAHRKTALKQMLDVVDKSLWARTAEITRRYNNQGMPAAQALHQGLARALSTGIAAEIITTGASRSAPQAQSLLGLGCYGCGPALAMGATNPRQGEGDTTNRPPVVVKPKDPPVVVRKMPPTVIPPEENIPGDIQQAQPSRLTVAPVNTGNINAPPVSAGPFTFGGWLLTRVWALGNGADIANRVAPPDMQFSTPSAISPDQAQFLHDILTAEKDANGKTDKMVFFTDNTLTYGYPESDAPAWFAALGITPQTPVRMHAIWYLRQAVGGFGAFKNPTDGKTMYLHLVLGPEAALQAWDPVSNPLVLKAWLSYAPESSLIDTLVGFLDPANAIKNLNPLNPLRSITEVVGAAVPIAKQVGGAVGDGLNILGDLACDLLNSPAAPLAAGAASVMVGAPPQVGMTGAAVAKGQCGSAPPPPPPPPPVPVSHFPVLPVAIAAGGVLVAYLLTRPSRKKT